MTTAATASTYDQRRCERARHARVTASTLTAAIIVTCRARSEQSQDSV